MSGIGIPGLILLVILALLLFGPSKLPELGRAVGRTLREFKRGASGLIDEDTDRGAKKEDASPEEEKPAAERRLPE